MLSGSIELLGAHQGPAGGGADGAAPCSTATAFPAFAEALSLLKGLVEQHWAVVHPQLDPDDDNDPTMRVTALAALATSGVMLPLRQSPLLESRALGPVSFADMFPAAGSPDNARISGVFESVELPALEEMTAALAAAAPTSTPSTPFSKLKPAVAGPISASCSTTSIRRTSR